ncbi:MAG: SPL family radical SAM protein [Gemmataceae bacterium]
MNVSKSYETIGVSRLPRIEWLERSGFVLHPTPLGEAPEVLGLNLTRGCGQRCAFCSIRAFPGYTGDQVLQVYKNTAARLDAELARRKNLPRAVFLSPSSDPFPPFKEVQAEAARVIQVLGERGVQAWIMTRGFIRPSVLKVLAQKPGSVKVTFAMTTLDRALQRKVESLSAPPRMRLRQMAELQRMGIAVKAALEPLIPGLTDTRENLEPLLEALAKAGIRQITAGYLFERTGIAENLQPVLEEEKLDDDFVKAYYSGSWLRAPGMASARYLSRRQRQRGYASLMALGSKLGITVSVSGVLNPDFQAPRIGPSSPFSRQPLLPLMGQQV